jgi:hypothetical protein
MRCHVVDRRSGVDGRRSGAGRARGGLAIGHSLGVTGKAAALVARQGGKYALAAQCIDGGQGIATVLEAMSRAGSAA